MEVNVVEVVKVVGGISGMGALILVLFGGYKLVVMFFPQAIAALLTLSTTLGKFGEQIESFGDKVDGLGVKVDAARERASTAANETSAMRGAFERSGSYPGVNGAGQGGAAPGAPPAPPPPPAG